MKKHLTEKEKLLNSSQSGEDIKAIQEGLQYCFGRSCEDTNDNLYCTLIFPWFNINVVKKG